MSKAIDKRLAELEQRANPGKHIVIYRENPHDGTTAEDFPERYAAAQIEAGPTGTVIVITYGEWPPVEGSQHIKLSWGDD